MIVTIKVLDPDHEMDVECVNAFYGLNKETHMQARHFALYIKDNNSEQFHSTNPREFLHST